MPDSRLFDMHRITFPAVGGARFDIDTFVYPLPSSGAGSPVTIVGQVFAAGVVVGRVFAAGVVVGDVQPE